MNPFDHFRMESDFREAWDSVQIARSIPYTLFTFGESNLPYYLVLGPKADGEQVSIRQGEIKIARPLIITPDNSAPELADFFDSEDDENYVRFLLARQASFSHLRFSNQRGSDRIVSDSIEEAVEKLTRRLDTDDEDRVAILVAPHRLAGLALVKYAANRVQESAPGNIRELREKGFLQ